MNVSHKKVRFDNYTKKELQTKFWQMETEFGDDGVQSIFVSGVELGF